MNNTVTYNLTYVVWFSNKDLYYLFVLVNLKHIVSSLVVFPNKRFFHVWTGSSNPVLFNESLGTATDLLNCKLIIMTRIVTISCISYSLLSLMVVRVHKTAMSFEFSWLIVRWKSFQWTWWLFRTCSALSKVLYYWRQARKQKHWK